MSILGLIDPEKESAGLGGIEAPSATLTDVFKASLESTARNYLTTSRGFFEGLETSSRDKAYRELTGRNLYDDAFEQAPNRDELVEVKRMGNRPDLVKKAVDDYLSRLKTQDPDRYSKVLNSSEITETVKSKAKDSLKKQAQVTSGATPLASLTGQLAGGAVASFADPLNLATIPLGAGMAAGIIKTALVEAGVNAATEVVSFPFVEKWQKELGQEYGASEFAENMGLAAIFGGVFGGGAKALSVGLEKMTLPNSAKLAELRSRVDDMPELNEALRHEERRLHIDEADPSKYNPEVEPSVHSRALEEVDSAINEGRSLDPSRIDLKDEDIAKMLPRQMDDALAQVHSKLSEPIELETPKKSKEINELVDLSESQPPLLAREQELLEQYESPEFRAQEKAQFEARFGEEADIDPNEKIILEDGQEMSVQELRDSFSSDAEYMSAITSCGIKRS